MKGKVKLLAVSLLALSLLAPLCGGGVEKSGSTYSDPGSIPVGDPPGWSDDILLSGPSTLNSDSDIAVEGDNVYSVYVGYDDPDFQIFFRSSSDAGVSWSAENQLTFASGWYDHPRIVVNGSKIHVVYDGGEVYYLNSTDGGVTWNNRVRISDLDGSWSWIPDIAIEGNNVYVVWQDWLGISPEVYYANSSDGGITWSINKNLTSNDGSSSGSAKICVNNSNIHVIWNDYKSGREIYYRSSYDRGVSWNPEKNITSIDGLNSEAPQIGIWGNSIHMVWWDDRFGHMEVMYKNSTDNGVTWNDPILLSGDDTHRSLQPDIAVWNNELHVVWNDERDNFDYYQASEVYYANSTDGGISWSSPQRLTNALNDSYQPAIATNGPSNHVVWTDNRTGNQLKFRIYYKRTPDFLQDPEFNITLSQGWNLISLPLEQSDESLDQALSSIAGKWDYIRIYDPLDPEPWKSNCTYKPVQLNDFDTLNHTQGFWINITESNVNLTVRGYEPSSTTIPLYEGWNLVGYPTLNSTKTIADAFAGINADIWMVGNTSEPYHIQEIGPAYVMKPGKGYWVHVTSDDVWIVNW